MKINNRLSVSSTNGYGRGSFKHPDAVRVYLDGILIGEVFPPKRHPLRYLRRHPGSRYKADLAEQIAPHGISIDEVVNVIGKDGYPTGENNEGR